MAGASIVEKILADPSGCIQDEPTIPSGAPSLTYSASVDEDIDVDDVAKPETRRDQRASTRLIAQSPTDVQRITGETTTQLMKRCCGGGCRFDPRVDRSNIKYDHIGFPDNDAYRCLLLKIDGIPSTLTNICELPEQTTFLEPVTKASEAAVLPDDTDTTIVPPRFVQPHPPHHLFPARIQDSRELTRPAAEKRTFHFDLDVTDYPEEEGIDFKVGGAIGVSVPNDADAVEHILDLLLVPRVLRDKPVLLRTTKGRYPTVWGDDQARELVTTRRDLITWCSDIQSYPPTKRLLRVLAEHSNDLNEKKILLFLCAAEGQGVFCDLRTGPHITLAQLLSAFPSARPPMGQLLSVLQPLMPRFYSLSNDPYESCQVRDGKRHRLVEVAVTVHETHDYRTGRRTGVGSGFFERQALKILAAREEGKPMPHLFIPMFKGLMANPLAKEYVADGPMLLIGAGVGIAPFRGFVQRRLKTANCANKVWVIQGIRDSLVDELYNGEWGVHEEEVKRVVQSRRGEGRYVQEEVRHQADLVWYIVNSVDGRVFVCGSSKGMGEGVEAALIDVAVQKGNLEPDEARKFWRLKREAGQYIAETW